MSEAAVNIQSNISTLLITGFGQMGNLKYVYFVLALFAFILTIFVNAGLIAVIWLKESLHQPMYIFLCHLSLNGLYGSTALYPKLLHDFLTEVQVITRIGCLAQLYCIHTYAALECTLLTVMAIDRFLSICRPLQYHSIMTSLTVSSLLIFAWLFPLGVFGVTVALTSRLPLCGYSIEKVYCDNWSFTRLSCVSTTTESVYMVFVTVIFPGMPFLIVIISYQQILQACLKASPKARSKAFNTCAPHIITFVNYCVNLLFEIISLRLGDKNLPSALCSFMSLQLFIVPPLLNPIVYTIRLTEIRSAVVEVIQRAKLIICPHSP
ncbi:olfactory receptor 2G3-like [Erpetoichthys calabaricus]|uniref:olfactory receptor 2G3-like n=1 Tax=Erpetoichthys calabaricus TaxID=27687 RepID=UPI00109FEAA1|nr:olfactory receptor 2G3-like [Erpetoichthys calabaricus]